MIEIEMLSSSDTNRVGTYKFLKEKLQLGSKLSDEFVLDFLKPVGEMGHLALEENGQLYFTPVNLEEFKVNGNKTRAKKRLMKGDKVEIFQNTFVIKEFGRNENRAKNEILNERLELLKQQKSPFIKLLKLFKE